MTYTQFTMDDWSTYLDSDWMANYHKIVIPSQSDYSAKPEVMEEMVTLKNLEHHQKCLIESFMAAGGTVQIHLTSSAEYWI